MTKPRLLYILKKFPQTSETYIKTEIEAVQDDYEVLVIARKQAELPHRTSTPYRIIDDETELRAAVKEFEPSALHGHWMTQMKTIGPLARELGIPFTIRTHSFDVLGDKSGSGLSRAPGENETPARVKKAVEFLNDELCLGVLSFPFVRPVLERAGIAGDKIIDCFPVINYSAFYDRSPNGNAIMNVGAALPKKKMEDFLQLGTLMPERDFNLYAMGYQVDVVAKTNEEMGGPVHIKPLIEPDDMPAEYKAHQWLVYTGDIEYGTVGWPMAVAEAQAAGVGVCMPNLRPDIEDYVGGAGVIYDSIADVKDVISSPVPEDMRERGFEQAKKSDIQEHKDLLTGLWDRAASA